MRQISTPPPPSIPYTAGLPTGLNTMQSLTPFQASQFERMTGAGSDYPSTITPLGFVTIYSLREQEQLLPLLAQEMGKIFHLEVLLLRQLSIADLAMRAQTEPLWEEVYSQEW